MAEELGSLYYDLDAPNDKLKRSLADADKHVKGFGDKIGQHWDKAVVASQRFAFGLAAIGVGIGAFAVSSVRSFQESQNAIAQTEAVLKSTGAAAGVTADQVSKLSDALQRTTRFSDEEIRSGQNLLLTFTKIGKDIFPEATKIILDMSTALGQDLKASAVQVGKALQDPVLGATALRRVGVNFSEDQQKVIKRLVETGKAAEAQRLIMKELQTEFGGSAEAAGRTLAGQLDILKNQFDEVKETIGGLLAQALSPLLTRLLEWFNSIGGAEGAMNMLREAMEKIKPFFPAIAGAILAGLIPAFVALASAAGLFNPVFLAFLAAGAAIGFLVQQLIQHFGGWSQTWDAIKNAAKGVWDVIGPILIPSFQALWNTVKTELLPALQELWQAVGPLLGPTLKVLAAIIIGYWVASVWAIINVMRIFAEVLSFAIRVSIDWYGAIAHAVSTVIGWFSRLPGNAANAVNSVVAWFAGLPGRILGAVGSLAGLLVGAGQDLIEGLIRGIISKFGELARKVRDAISGAVNTIKGFLGIRSPSRVFMEIGRNVTEGFVKGITDTSHLAVAAMGNLGGNIITPAVNLSPGTATAPPGSTTRYGDNIFNIGEIHNEQDEAYVLRRLDRDAQLISMGGAPE